VKEKDAENTSKLSYYLVTYVCVRSLSVYLWHSNDLVTNLFTIILVFVNRSRTYPESVFRVLPLLIYIFRPRIYTDVSDAQSF
jgi:hypothetical protein